jgi:hypothetical protein
MATVYLPVEATIAGMTSEQRATAINAEVWCLVRPASVQEPEDTKYLYGQITHPTTGEVAIVGDTDDELPVHPDVDLTELLELLPEVPQAEKDGLVMFIDANRGSSVPFGQLIPSTSTQLTQAEAEALGWLPDPIEP